MNYLPDKDPSLRDLINIFRRRKMTVYVTVAIVFSMAMLICVVATRKYESSSVVQLQKSSADGLNLDSMISGAAGGASDSLSVNIDLQTQAGILQSDTLALKVIKDLQLENTRDFQPKMKIVSWLFSRFDPDAPAEPQGSNLEDAPLRRQRLLKIFEKNLNVKVVAGTRLIEVSYTSSDPKTAANVVNHLVQGLIDYTFQTKFTAANDVSHWLEGQLGDLRKENESLQAKVVAMQKETGLFGMGGADLQGRPIVFSPTLDRLQQTTNQLADAQMSRILRGSVYEVVRSGNAELISQLSGNALAGASAPVTNSLTLIQSLRSREAALEEQIGQDSAKFGAAYPKLAEERAALVQVRNSLQAEIARTGTRAKNDYEVASKTEQGARGAYENARHEAEKLNDKTIEYSILEREATQSQQLYQDLLRRLREAGIIEGLKASNITVIDPGRPPAKPSSPKVALDLAMGLGFGLFLGCCGALFVEAVDNKVLGAEEVEMMELPVLGLLPHFPSANGNFHKLLPTAKKSTYVEALRGLRSTILISRSGTPPKVLLVTSSSPNEGKSTTSMNLAASMAQLGKRVLLVEADMRRPVMQKRLGLERNPGLSGMLADRTARCNPLPVAEHPNLWALPAGPVPPYPAELLGGQRLQELLQQWRDEYDFIVIDSPPVLPVVDSLTIATLVDVTVVIARAGATTRVALQRTYKTLLPHASDPSSPGIGVVVNAISPRSEAYYGYYGYYGDDNAYHYGSSEVEVEDARV